MPLRHLEFRFDTRSMLTTRDGRTGGEPYGSDGNVGVGFRATLANLGRSGFGANVATSPRY